MNKIKVHHGNFKAQRNLKKIKVISIDFSDTHFNQCSFKDIIFENCTFSCCYFENCSFTNIEFNNCSFSESNGDIDVLNTISKFKLVVLPTIFNDCEFYEINFVNNTSLNFSYFVNCTIPFDMTFTDAELAHCCFVCCKFGNIIMDGCDLSSCNFIDIKVTFFSFSLDKNKNDSIINKHTSFDNFISDYKLESDDYEKISDFYFKLSNIFYENNFMAQYSKYYYLSRYYDKKAEYLFHKKVFKYLNDFICGFGEKPGRTLLVALFVIFLFSIIFMFSGLSLPDYYTKDMVTMYQPDYKFWQDIVKSSETLSGILYGIVKLLFYYIPIEYLKDYVYFFYFSVVTFTTVGYGDITPISPLSKILSNIEMLIGVTLAGIWVATLSRKMMR
jgi:hypothetical protein